MTRCLVALGAIAIALAIAVSAEAASGPGAAGRGGGGGRKQGIVLSGAVEGLFPGGTSHLPVTIANGEAFAVALSSLTVSAGDASPGCPASVLGIGPTPTGVVIPARGSVVVTIPVVLHDEAPNTCQGAQFSLRYEATATAASRADPAT